MAMARSSSTHSAGFSLSLKMILILGLVIWNVEGAPSGSEVIKVKASSSMTTNSDPVFQAEPLMNSRQRRSVFVVAKRNAQGKLEMRVMNDTSEMTNKNGKFADGRRCENGEPELKEAEVALLKESIEKALKITGDSMSAYAAGSQVAADLLGGNCASGKCRYYDTKYQAICRSSSIQPMSILIGMILGFFVFQMIDCE